MRTQAPLGETSLRRYASVKPRANEREARLRADHPALLQGRTIFTTTVVEPEEAPRLLVDGHNSPKIGRKVQKGPWAGMRIFTLTLEERATCPRNCSLWAACYGNSMPFARRHRAGPDMELLLGAELQALAEEHPDGFVVRLHVLGDFYSLRYAARWAVWMHAIPQLHVFGYTAWARSNRIGAMVARLNDRWPDRWRVRFSRPAALGRPLTATTIWRQPEGPWVPEGLVCPAQTDRTACCATCGLCWSPAMDATPIVFIGHGLVRRRARA